MKRMTKDAILGLLRERPDSFVSGEDISRQLGITRAAVWKYVKQLESEGYQFEAVSKKGYRLLYSPDLLISEEIRPYLKTDTIGQKIDHYNTTVSTNDEAKKLANRGEPEGTVVIAEEQTGGRGRTGGSWASEKGKSILMSLILRPDAPLSESAAIASKACRTIGKVLGTYVPEVEVQAPDDVFIGGKKVCGILTETAGELDRIRFMILGIGILVNEEKDGLPPAGSVPFTSMRLEAGKEIPRQQLTAQILNEFEKSYSGGRR